MSPGQGLHLLGDKRALRIVVTESSESADAPAVTVPAAETAALKWNPAATLLMRKLAIDGSGVGFATTRPTTASSPWPSAPRPLNPSSATQLMSRPHSATKLELPAAAGAHALSRQLCSICQERCAAHKKKPWGRREPGTLGLAPRRAALAAAHPPRESHRLAEELRAGGGGTLRQAARVKPTEHEDEDLDRELWQRQRHLVRRDVLKSEAGGGTPAYATGPPPCARASLRPREDRMQLASSGR